MIGLLGRAYPRDLNGRYANDPNKAWFSNLKNGNGTACCDNADGKRIEAPDWRQNEDGTYSVRLQGDWKQLDPLLVLKDHNRVGFAVLWQYNGQVTCFMPGSVS